MNWYLFELKFLPPNVTTWLRFTIMVPTYNSFKCILSRDGSVERKLLLTSNISNFFNAATDRGIRIRLASNKISALTSGGDQNSSFTSRAPFRLLLDMSTDCFHTTNALTYMVSS